MSKVRRPVVRWFGGKWRAAPEIIRHFPKHRIYVEPYGGGGSVLLRKPRSYAEIYNDLDVQIVNLFRVLRDPVKAQRLAEFLRLTPFARDEFKASYQPSDDPLEQARRFVVMAYMGFGSNAHAGRSTGFRASARRTGTTPAHDWAKYPESLHLVVDRLRGMTIERLDALNVMAAHDSAETLHYVDPPYIQSTRGRHDRQRNYRHEMSDDQHSELLEFLKGLNGRVVLSGYAHPLYDEALADWRRVEFDAMADGARPRREILWLNFDSPAQQSLELHAVAAE